MPEGESHCSSSGSGESRENWEKNKLALSFKSYFPSVLTKRFGTCLGELVVIIIVICCRTLDYGKSLKRWKVEKIFVSTKLKNSLFQQSGTYRLRSVLIKGTVRRRERGAEKRFNINLLQLHIFYGREWVSSQFKINSKLRMSWLDFFAVTLCLRYLLCILYIVFSRVNWSIEMKKTDICKQVKWEKPCHL